MKSCALVKMIMLPLSNDLELCLQDTFVQSLC